ncbi:MAG: SDR family oxidoreductase [Candidatus Nitrospinota bacterium M3_3B_026]
MSEEAFDVVTGAFGYSGKYITKFLLEKGRKVRTITGSPERENPFGEKVAPFPFNFGKPEKLVETLRGADVLYNTYWVRFNHGDFTHEAAVQNTFTLFAAAKEAGVRRVVHISITNPSEDSPLEYFRGKARQERSLMESGLSYAILRPTVLFGDEDILINNIAWVLRRFPAFGLFGFGDYRLRPMFVEDMAALAVEQGEGSENVVIDAVGPESFAFRDLVETIADAIGVRRLIVPMPPFAAHLFGAVMGKLKGDVLITRDEIDGLMAGLLDTDSPATGATRLTEWIRENRETLGRKYSSELARRLDRKSAYERL